MQAVLLLGPGQLSYQDIPIPQPGADEVVLKIGAALTCGTDLKALLRGHPKMPPPPRFVGLNVHFACACASPADASIWAAMGAVRPSPTII